MYLPVIETLLVQMWFLNEQNKFIDGAFKYFIVLNRVNLSSFLCT